MPGKKRSPIQKHRGLSGDLPPGSPVWVYLRHSPGEEQTIDSQRRDAEAFVAVKGLVVLHWWIDEAKHGGLVESRDAFQAMMAASQRQPPPVRAIVVWDLSRFSRDILEPQYYLADLRIRGYQVVSIHDDLPSGEFASIFESLLIWKNHRYLLDLSANVRRGQDATVNSVVEVGGKQITGFSAGGPPPVGYAAARIHAGVKPSGKGRYLVYWEKTKDEDLLGRVALAWKMALESARAGCKVEVGRIHAATKIHKSLSTYYHFFRSPTYKGTRHVGERLVDGAHEGYVSPEEWELVQHHMPVGRPSPIDRHPRRVNSPFYLSGRTYCGYCGSRIDYEPDNRIGRYAALRCAGKKRDAASCPLSKLSYDQFMECLLDLLRREILTEERLRASIHDLNEAMAGSAERLAEERRRLGKEIATAARSIDRLLAAIEEGQALSSLQGRLAMREKEKAHLEAELAAVALAEREARPLTMSREAMRALIRRLKEGLGSADPEVARPILQGLIRRVTLWNEKARVEFSLPPAPISDFAHDLRSMLWRARGDSNPRSPA